MKWEKITFESELLNNKEITFDPRPAIFLVCLGIVMICISSLIKVIRDLKLYIDIFIIMHLRLFFVVVCFFLKDNTSSEFPFR